jgi:hypothetical protein
MRTRAKTAVAAIGLTTLAVVGLDAGTYAGTGDSLILGKLNKANKPTTITNTATGPALSLQAAGEQPALAVDSEAKIVELNADRIDGKDAAALQNNVYVLTATEGTSTEGYLPLRLPPFPPGFYQVTYEVFLSGASGTVSNPTIAYCELQEEGRDFHASAYTSVTAEGFSVGLSASGVLVKDGDSWLLTCKASQHNVGADDWSITPDRPARVTLTRMDHTIDGSLIDPSTTSARPLAEPGR